MPIYEYRCENGHLFEVMQKITDDPVTQCEVCDASVSRVFHPVAVHFKRSEERRVGKECRSRWSPYH